REWYVSDDIEELEYAALNRAAAASLRLIVGNPDEARLSAAYSSSSMSSETYHSRSPGVTA
ncbi:hypothetical protein JHN49_08620, partial [Streptomyces sp. MBT57]|nr:hypothetical protein [Streptomyces sp. MBT57]